MLHEATVYRLISAQVTGKVGSMPIKWGGQLNEKKSPLQITWGGDRLKYHYDINIYEN